MKNLAGKNPAAATSKVVEDPLGYDHQSDPVVVTTRRGLSRIAFVAAETAARFQREGIDYDPVAWMMTTRELFEGSTALDACLERQPFLRAAILHGLSWGLDASPHAIDAFIEDDDDDWLDDGDEPDHMEGASEQDTSPGRHGTIAVMHSTEAPSRPLPHHAPVSHPERPVVPRRHNRVGRAASSRGKATAGESPL